MTYSTKQACEMTGVSRNRLSGWVCAGRIPGQPLRVGGGHKRRYTVEQIECIRRIASAEPPSSPRRKPFKDGLARTGEASVILGVSAKLVSSMCRDGIIPTLPRDYCLQYQIRVEDLARFAATYRRRRYTLQDLPRTHAHCLRRKHGYVCDECRARILDAWDALWKDAA